MAYVDAIKYNQIRSMKGLPIGAILPWASDQSFIPSGWIVCNGATISSTSYPLLFDVIGNTYGGTPGSTYKLPPLTNSSKSIVDIFRGHYQHLKTNGGAANAPTSNSISNDAFWTIVANGDGDQGSNNQGVWTSDIDLVGRFNGSPSFFALYDAMTITAGSYSFTATWAETTLEDVNLAPHSHGSPSGATSVRLGDDKAGWCKGLVTSRECYISCDSTAANRIAAEPEATKSGQEPKGNQKNDLKRNFVDKKHTWPGGSAQGTGGGGTIKSTPPGSATAGTGYGESGATVYNGGNGRCGGDMGCTWPALFTSLSNLEGTGQGGEVVPHEHGVTTFNLASKYNVISPGLRNDISLGSVAINQEAGRNAGTILATTETPSLEMLYIIRAF